MRGKGPGGFDGGDRDSGAPEELRGRARKPGKRPREMPDPLGRDHSVGIRASGRTGCISARNDYYITSFWLSNVPRGRIPDVPRPIRPAAVKGVMSPAASPGRV